MKLPHGLLPRPGAVPRMPAAVGASGLHLAEATTETEAAPPVASALTVGTLIYAIGTLDYTFANGARRDLVVQEMLPGTPFLRHDLVTYLAAHPAQAEWLTWTLNVDATPIYALRPAAAFGRVLYAQLQQWLGQFPEEMHIHLSVLGVITGTTRLLSGTVVPVLHPVLHGLYCWSQRSYCVSLCSMASSMPTNNVRSTRRSTNFNSGSTPSCGTVAKLRKSGP
jgi:hypothetical protein